MNPTTNQTLKQSYHEKCELVAELNDLYALVDVCSLSLEALALRLELNDVNSCHQVLNQVADRLFELKHRHNKQAETLRPHIYPHLVQEDKP